jgi:GT2 family glycosyltransferase
MSFLVPILPDLSAESLAQSILAAHRQGNFEEAEIYSRVMWQRYSHVPESGALLAQTLVKQHKAKQALKVWDKVLCSNPLKSEWLTQAVTLAGAHNAEEMLHRWTQMLRRIFIQAPPLGLLHKLQSLGYEIKGSVGIHCGYVLGWAWLALGEKLKIQPYAINDLGRIESSTQEHAGGTLTTFQIRIPDAEKLFTLRFSTSTGEELQGSPLVCESSRSVSFPPLEAATHRQCEKKVSVIVPVYDDFHATRVCLASLLHSRRCSSFKFDILIVWDHGPDAQILAWLQRLAGKHDLTLLSTPHNLGFLGAVNHALRHVGNGDVVLLNADTIVHGNWVERLHDIRTSVDDVGTITPMSSCAEQVSFPHINNPASVTTLRHTARLDQACQQAARKKVYHDIPVGVGFCLYITRELLHRAGGLDGHWLYNGYGEEVDLCLRAREYKLRNLAALNVFVAHLGTRSFGPGKQALVAQNNKALAMRYPDYYAEYRDFLRIDPLRIQRQKISHQYCKALNATVHILEADCYADPTLSQVIQRLNAPEDCLDKFPESQNEGSAQPPNTALILVSRTAEKIYLDIKICADIQLADIHLQLPRNRRRFRDLVQRLSPDRVMVHGCSELLWQIATQLEAPCELVLQRFNSELAHAYNSNHNPQAILPRHITRIQCHSVKVAAWLRGSGYKVRCIQGAKKGRKKGTKISVIPPQVRPFLLKAKGPRSFAVPSPMNVEQWLILTAFAGHHAHAGVVCYVYGLEYMGSSLPRPGNVRPVPGYAVDPPSENDKVLEPFIPAGILLFPDDPEQHALWSAWAQEHKLPCFIFPRGHAQTISLAPAGNSVVKMLSRV